MAKCCRTRCCALCTHSRYYSMVLDAFGWLLFHFPTSIVSFDRFFWHVQLNPLYACDFPIPLRFGCCCKMSMNVNIYGKCYSLSVIPLVVVKNVFNRFFEQSCPFAADFSFYYFNSTSFCIFHNSGRK